jgi:predicted kinase
LALSRGAKLNFVRMICSDERLLRKRLEERKGTGNSSDADFRVYEIVKNKFASVVEKHLEVDNVVLTIEELKDLVFRLILPFIIRTEF